MESKYILSSDNGLVPAELWGSIASICWALALADIWVGGLECEDGGSDRFLDGVVVDGDQFAEEGLGANHYAFSNIKLDKLLGASKFLCLPGSADPSLLPDQYFQHLCALQLISPLLHRRHHTVPQSHRWKLAVRPIAELRILQVQLHTICIGTMHTPNSDPCRALPLEVASQDDQKQSQAATRRVSKGCDIVQCQEESA